MTQKEIKIAIGAQSSNIYFNELREQCNGGKMKYGAINTLKNLKMHYIPEPIFESIVDVYDKFLVERRNLMGEKMRKYYISL